jgi:hypothetical protein
LKNRLRRARQAAHSRRLASHPLRPVFLKPAPSRGQVGSITPESKVRRPYAKALEPGRSLVFDWLVDLGFAHREDGQWLVWRSRRLEGD